MNPNSRRATFGPPSPSIRAGATTRLNMGPISRGARRRHRACDGLPRALPQERQL